MYLLYQQLKTLTVVPYLNSSSYSSWDHKLESKLSKMTSVFNIYFLAASVTIPSSLSTSLMASVNASVIEGNETLHMSLSYSAHAKIEKPFLISHRHHISTLVNYLFSDFSLFHLLNALLKSLLSSTWFSVCESVWGEFCHCTATTQARIKLNRKHKTAFAPLPFFS